MAKTRSTKRALLVSLLALLTCVSMLVGSTFAWFTDSVTSGNNIIKSGTLDIVLEYWDGDSWEDAEGEIIPFVAADGRAQSEILWEPGCTYEMAPFRVRNVGNLAAKILIKLNGVTGDEKLMEVVELKNHINNIPDSVLNGSAGNQLQRFEDADLDIMYGTPDGNIVFDWSLAGEGDVTPGTGHTDTSPEFTLFGHMAEEAGNEYQGLSIEGISITVIATQETYESDSFNKYYDKNATFPVLVSDAEGLNEAIAAGKPATLTEDITIGKIDLTNAVTNDVVIDGKGHKITTTDSYGIEVTAGKNITISNAEIEMTKPGDYITYAAGFKVSNGDYAGATITLSNCTITMANTDWAYAVTMPASVKNLNLVIDNCTLEGAISLQCWGDNNTITITNSDLICNYTTSAQYTSYCVALQSDGTYIAENNKLVIDNCAFSYSGVDNFNSKIYSVKNLGNNNTVTVTNCTYGAKVVAE